MRRKTVWLIAVAAGTAAILFALTQRLNQPTTSSNPTHSIHAKTQSPAPERISSTDRIPAHYETAPPIGSLPATLPPERFNGKAREAYQAVRLVPQLIAQLPCYCHCDRGLGHKSLHSCFEDDHAAVCATCIDEALIAYELQKRGMSATRIREQIIAQIGD